MGQSKVERSEKEYQNNLKIMSKKKIHIWTYVLSISLLILVIQSCGNDNTADQQTVENEIPDNYKGQHDLFEFLPADQTGVTAIPAFPPVTGKVQHGIMTK